MEQNKNCVVSTWDDKTEYKLKILVIHWNATNILSHIVS